MNLPTIRAWRRTLSVGIATVLAAGLVLVPGTQPAMAEPDCTKIPTPPRCRPDWRPPGYQKTYRVQPEWLEVIETQDDGADEAYIAFMADHRWSASVNNGDWVNLSHLTNWRFVNTAQSLTLKDLDAGADGPWWDPDDQLGFTVFHPIYADGSLRVASFTEAGAHYRLHYRLHYEGCRPVTQSCPQPPS